MPSYGTYKTRAEAAGADERQRSAGAPGRSFPGRRLLFPALALFAVFSLLSLLSTRAEAGPAGGHAIFKAKCASCHSVKKPAAKPTIKERLAEKGPALWYAGSKFKKGFIEDWLRHPTPIRGMKYNSLTERADGSHISLSKREASVVAAYLEGLKSADVVDAGIKPKATVRGRFIFQKKLGCYGCHTIRRGSKIVGGLTGPTLLGAAKRLDPDWIYSYLKNPRAFTPLSPMPNYSKMLSEVKLRALAAYVAAQE